MLICRFVRNCNVIFPQSMSPPHVRTVCLASICDLYSYLFLLILTPPSNHIGYTYEKRVLLSLLTTNGGICPQTKVSEGIGGHGGGWIGHLGHIYCTLRAHIHHSTLPTHTVQRYVHKPFNATHIHHTSPHTLTASQHSPSTLHRPPSQRMTS